MIMTMAKIDKGDDDDTLDDDYNDYDAADDIG